MSKWIALLLLAAVSPADAFARNITCWKTSPERRTLQIRIVQDGAYNHSILVLADSRVLHRRKIERIDTPRATQTYYFSDSFVNANRAPSTLMLQVYVEAGRLKGEFNEGSFLPTLPREYEGTSWGMDCRSQ